MHHDHGNFARLVGLHHVKAHYRIFFIQAEIKNGLGLQKSLGL